MRTQVCQRWCAGNSHIRTDLGSLVVLHWDFDMHVPTRDASIKVNTTSFIFVFECIQIKACTGLLCQMDAPLHAAMTFERF